MILGTWLIFSFCLCIKSWLLGSFKEIRTITVIYHRSFTGRSTSYFTVLQVWGQCSILRFEGVWAMFWSSWPLKEEIRMEREHYLLRMSYQPAFPVIMSGEVRGTLWVKQCLWCMFFANTLSMLTEVPLSPFIPTHPHPGMNVVSCTPQLWIIGRILPYRH